MGGDGGVIASNRLYLRGAGAASHTADRNIKGSKSNDEEQRESRDSMRSCTLTGASLHTKDNSCSIVSCPYGKLYRKEAAVEALIRRKGENQTDEIGSHVRGLKDLYSVKLHYSGEEKTMPTCPITGEELNGGQATFLIVRKSSKSQAVNVMSERALREVGIEGLQSEYGPFQKEDMVRLAPPSRDLEDIKENWKRRMEEEEELRLLKKSGKKIRNKRRETKKRKEPPQKEEKICTIKQGKKTASSNSTQDAANLARTNVACAVASNSALSSLFVKKTQSLSTKEKNDNLFVR